jgi:uncharacterized protein
MCSLGCKPWTAQAVYSNAKPWIGLQQFATIGYSGDVVVLSPEFLDINCTHYEDFIVGNLMEDHLETILGNAAARSYVQNYLAGRVRCQKTCVYYSSCGGGCASNKFFEHGSTEATETKFAAIARRY